jgi:hypothetical protein
VEAKLCAHCGNPVEMSNDEALLTAFYHKTSDIIGVYKVAQSRHIMPTANCKGTPHLAEILSNGEVDCADDLRVTLQELRDKILTAYQDMLYWLQHNAPSKEDAPPACAKSPTLNNRDVQTEVREVILARAVQRAIELFARELEVKRSSDLTLTLDDGLAVTLYTVSGWRFASIHPVDKPELELASLGLVIHQPA